MNPTNYAFDSSLKKGISFPSKGNFLLLDSPKDVTNTSLCFTRTHREDKCLLDLCRGRNWCGLYLARLSIHLRP